MANRVLSSEVKEIISTDIADVTPFITPANLIVTAKLSNSGLDSGHLKEIEKWLAAHFVSSKDQRVQSESIGGTSVSYQGQTGLGLDSTQYGQQVKVLDTTGELGKLGMAKATLSTIKYSE